MKRDTSSAKRYRDGEVLAYYLSMLNRNSQTSNAKAKSEQRMRQVEHSYRGNWAQAFRAEKRGGKQMSRAEIQGAGTYECGGTI